MINSQTLPRTPKFGRAWFHPRPGTPKEMGPSSVARLRKVYRSGTLLPGYWVDSSNRNLHLAIHQPCWIGAHRLVGAGQTGTGLYVEFPAMQRTEDLAVFKTADAERPAARWALVINREELTIQIEQRKLPPLHMHRAAMPGRQAGNLGDGSKCAHRLASEASRLGNHQSDE